jgi:hypothetical protein
MRYSRNRRRAALGIAAAVTTFGVCALGPAAGASDSGRPAPVLVADTAARLQPPPGPVTLFPLLAVLDRLFPFLSLIPFSGPAPAPMPSLSFSYTQGKGASSPTTTGPCDTLLVLITGHNFPPALYGEGQLDLYDATGALFDYEDYSWNPQGPQSQLLDVVQGTALEAARSTTTPPFARVVTVVVAGHPNVSASFPLECTPAAGGSTMVG